MSLRVYSLTQYTSSSELAVSRCRSS